MGWQPTAIDISVKPGHASPTIALATYAHLMPADEEVARAILDAALAPAQAECAPDVHQPGAASD